ncbi:MAG: Fur family transcriptional regulator [Phycisphaerales bacterium]|jgi:Fur family ferric uptake transcriptional regulator
MSLRSPASTLPPASDTGSPSLAAPVPAMPLCSVFRRFLKARGLKYTGERAEILDKILAFPGHFEAEELIASMRSARRRVSKATVYRTIKLLQEAGIIAPALFDGKQSHYQLAHGREPRDWMVCVRTGRTLDFSAPELAALRDRICRELGWIPVGHRFQIYAESPIVAAEPGDHPSGSSSGSSGRETT